MEWIEIKDESEEEILESSGVRTNQSLTNLEDIQESEGKVKCSECSMEYPSLIHLYIHIAREHPKDKNFKCTICGAGFNSDKNLRKHVKVIHSVLSMYKCKFCTARFRRNDYLKKHLSSHHEEVSTVTFRCRLCSEQYNSRETLNWHQKIKHKNFKQPECDICGENFYTKNQVRQHMTVHSSEINLYKCTECGAVFSLETNLRRHIQMTHTLTRFKCQYCGREFKRKDYLKGHLETVHPDLYKSLKPKKNGVEEKKYLHTQVSSENSSKSGSETICHICQKKFKNKYTLKAHMRIHSRQEFWKTKKTETETVKNVETEQSGGNLQVITKAITLVQNPEPSTSKEIFLIQELFNCEICNIIFDNRHAHRKHIQELHCYDL